MMRGNHRLGLCFHVSGNPVDCENIVIRWFTRKHLYRHQKHVSESTRAEDMLKSVYLATLVVESGNPVVRHLPECHHSIAHHRKHMYRHQKHVPESIIAEDM